MPVVVLRADAVGIAGDETCAELEAHDALRAKLSKMNFPAPYPILESVGASITEKMEQMEGEAGEKNFEAANDTLNRATAKAAE